MIPPIRRIALAAVPVALVAAAAWAQTNTAKAPAPPSIVERGRYLAQAGDCIACHTVPGAKIFSGNRAMPTPFGTLYAPNITPDRETGIGSWSADDFYHMMHTGR
jgi:mono/diheme cytochrome c family protein